MSFLYRRVRTTVRCAAALALAATVASCMSVAKSIVVHDVDTGSGRLPSTCHTQLGNYYLPKSFLQVKIESATAAGKTDYVLTDLTTIVRADTRRFYCLDYLASAFADDQINVTRATGDKSDSQQLLRSVTSNAVDQTAIIIRTLIRAGFTALSAALRSGVSPAAATDAKFETVADLAFDPFNQVQVALINDRTRQFGFCFVLETFTFGRQTRTSVKTYCDDPKRVITKPTPFAALYAQYEAYDIPPTTEGIFYRPRANYELSVYAKDDPGGRGDWTLRRTMPVSLENISPVISVKLDRAAFTEKQIALVFNAGDLADVCIFKRSELVEAAKIPLEIAKSIVALPTQILQIQYDQITQSQALVSAENNLLQSQAKLLTLLQNPTNSDNTVSPGGAPKLIEKQKGPASSLGPIEAISRTVTGDFSQCKAKTSSPDFPLTSRRPA